MKRLILAIYLCLLMVSPAFAWMGAVGVGASGGSALSCTGATVQQSEEAANSTQKFSDGAFDWIASEILYSGSTGSLCRLDVYLTGSTGSETGTITSYIYSDNATGDVPGSLVANCGTYDAAGLSASPTYSWISFTSCDATITNGVTYWIVLTRNTQDGTNYPLLVLDSSCAVELVKRGGDITAMTSTASSTSCGAFKLYIKE